MLTLRGHTGRVNDVAYTGNGARLVSASDDQTVKVWEASRGKQPLLVPGSYSLAFSSDGRFMATHETYQTIGIWNIRTGEKVLSKKHPFHVSSVAFRPHSRELHAPGADVIVWNLAGKKVYSKKSRGSVNQAVYSPNGRILGLANGRAPGLDQLFLLNAATGKDIRSLTIPRSLFSVTYCVWGLALTVKGSLREGMTSGSGSGRPPRANPLRPWAEKRPWRTHRCCPGLGLQPRWTRNSLGWRGWHCQDLGCPGWPTPNHPSGWTPNSLARGG